MFVLRSAMFCVIDTWRSLCCQGIYASAASKLQRQIGSQIRSAAHCKRPEPRTRWRPADGGLYWKNGELVEDKTKKNRWFPKIDLKDGRSPVPGISLVEYILRRCEQSPMRINSRPHRLIPIPANFSRNSSKRSNLCPFLFGPRVLISNHLS
jgi:hypothetical protein